MRKFRVPLAHSCLPRVPLASSEEEVSSVGASKSLNDGHSIAVVVGRFDPMTARGLAGLLDDDPQVHICGRDLSPTALEDALTRCMPHVAILDDPDERMVLRLRSIRPTTGLIVLARDPPLALGMRLLAAGATCVTASISSGDLIEVVHLAAQGDRMFVPSYGNPIKRYYPRDARSLTKRETQVLEHLSKNESYAEIALALEISPETVRRHTVNICKKLNVKRKRDLVGTPTRQPARGA